MIAMRRNHFVQAALIASSSSLTTLAFHQTSKSTSHLPVHFLWKQRSQLQQYSSLPWKQNTRQWGSANLISREISSSSNKRNNNEDSIRKMTQAEFKMTDDIEKMIDRAIKAVDPVQAVHKFLKVEKKGELQVSGEIYDTSAFDQVVLVAFGKASSAMASAVLDRLLEAGVEDITGLVICKEGNHCTDGEREYLEKYAIAVKEASHPVPDERSVNSSLQLLDLVKSKCSNNSKTLVIACISGGGSALFCAPHPELLTLEDLMQTNTALLQSGLSITDMNVIRKRLEQGKGGRLAAAAAVGSDNSRVVSLILSDVLGDPLDLIASGPTVPDSSNWQNAWDIVEQTPILQQQLPRTVLALLQDGKDGKYDTRDNLISSPSSNHPIFERSQYELVGNNAAAVYAAADEAERLGYHAIVLGTQWQGEASTVAQVLVSMAQHLKQESSKSEKYLMFGNAVKNIALVVGGETVVTISNDCQGLGGRNQELALAAALSLDNIGLENVVIASIGTDGTDGPTDAAGAIVNSGTIQRIDFSTTPSAAKTALQQHDAYNYFNTVDPREIGGTGKPPLDKRGPTGTNVADIMIVLIRRHS